MDFPRFGRHLALFAPDLLKCIRGQSASYRAVAQGLTLLLAVAKYAGITFRYF